VDDKNGQKDTEKIQKRIIEI
jgi:protein tyrosine phosphatase (PTP) superfamily phosphohydrolase (DUF442 family)